MGAAEPERLVARSSGPPGPSSFEDNVKAAGVTLDADLLKAIDDALDPVVERDPAKTESPANRP